MLEIAIMIEGQNGLNWARWQRMAQTVEDLGFAGLYRSDHYTNMNPPDLDSLELWVSLTWLASHTQRIEFGPLVSPVSFRHPTMTARFATAVDDLSNGRLTLGLGAGWQEREHTNFGRDLLELEERFKRFEEGLEVITRLINSDSPLDFQGQYYRLKDAVLLPRPKRQAGPPILIGGNGPRYTLPLAARYADEWNAVYISPAKFEKLNARLDVLLADNKRQPKLVRRSLMTRCLFGQSPTEVSKKMLDYEEEPAELFRRYGFLIGSATEIRDQLDAFDAAGVQRIMLQWLDLDDLDGLEAMARGIL